MAFIDGYITRYECPICKVGCSIKFKLGDFKYKHPNDIVLVNGYPSPCKNNEKELTEEEVNIVQLPNIVGQRGFY